MSGGEAENFTVVSWDELPEARKLRGSWKKELAENFDEVISRHVRAIHTDTGRIEVCVEVREWSDSHHSHTAV